MDVEIILLSIGVFISLLLGLINFLWGGGVLSRKDKVSVREAELDTSMVLHQKNEAPYLFFKSGFKLVRTSGDQDLYFESAYIELNKAICDRLNKYINLPPDYEVRWSKNYRGIGSNDLEKRRLRANEAKEFSILESFIIQDSLLKIFEEEEREGKATVSPEITDDLIRLKGKFKIVWEDQRGKKWHYRIPQKFWYKFLPEWLWWKVG